MSLVTTLTPIYLNTMCTYGIINDTTYVPNICKIAEDGITVSTLSANSLRKPAIYCNFSSIVTTNH